MDTAVVIGINRFPHLQHCDLRGCCNDADNLEELFREHCDDVTVLKDAAADKASIMQAIESALQRSTHYFYMSMSSHGTQLRDDAQDPDERYDGLDEAFITSSTTGDMRNVIRDDEFYRIFRRYPDVTKRILLDCCHAGTGLRFLPQTTQRRIRYIPNPNVAAGHIVRPVKRALAAIDIPNLMLFAGCRSNEYCQDAEINGTWNGAFTWAFMNSFSEKIKMVELYRRVVKLTRPYNQLPQLECHPQDLSGTFFR